MKGDNTDVRIVSQARIQSTLASACSLPGARASYSSREMACCASSLIKRSRSDLTRTSCERACARPAAAGLR